VHFPNTKVPIAETMGAMEEMKDKGKLLSIGVSNFSLQQTKDANAALKKSQLASNQVEYSLANREIEAELLPYCESNKISVISYYPLGHGKLTGSGPSGKMEAICKAYSRTPAQVALNWLVSRRNVFAIPRASRAKHVTENLGASGWEMRPEDRAQLEAAFPR
jgi:diketogulonate reductase-like aldo/keto reductase